MTKMRIARLSLKEQCFFIKRLSFLIVAGTPLSESLVVLREQAGSRGQRILIEHLTEDVLGGQSLSRSLARFPRVFGDFAVSLVRVGESSGTLSENLQYLAEELQKRHALKNKMIGALLYPALISAATLGIVGFLMLYLFPKLLPVFESLHASLPLSTRIVIAVSGFLVHWGLLMGLLLIGGIAAGAWLLRRNKTARALFDRVLLSLPLAGGMVRSFNIANACRTLGLLLVSGVSLGEALQLTADAMHNLVYKQHYRALAARVARGEKMSAGMRRYPAFFPDIMTHMISVGERSGSLSESLRYLAGLYEAEVDELTKNTSTLLEPVLMLVMGLLVGFIALSIITPLYGITQDLHA